jgi:cytochrome P450
MRSDVELDLIVYTVQTSVGVHQLSASRSIHNFKDPLKFVPERWLKDGSIDEVFKLQYGNDELAASQPFAMGSRGCIGKVNDPC